MTLNANSMTDEEVRRLSWRCRRGLLELDIVLQHFSEHHLAGLSLQELAVFDGLLDLPDNEFLDVVTARKAFTNVKNTDDVVIQKVLTKLRNNSIGET